MALKIVSSADLKGKKVFLRVDFNVPLEKGTVGDDTRIRAHLETIRLLMGKGSKTALVSHLGRPKGSVVPELSLQPICAGLAEILDIEVPFLDECIGEKVSEALERTPEGGVILLENTRFHPEEEANDPVFSRKLAEPFDIFVMDAFSASHRAHASTRGVADHLEAYAGLLVEKELRFLGPVRDEPQKPLVLILGGAKVTDKIGVIENMADKVAVILVGGAMAFPFLKVRGLSVGRSKCDDENTEKARYILEKTQDKPLKIVLPKDFIVARSPEDPQNAETAGAESFPANLMGLDIGPETRNEFANHVSKACTVLWNGPLGMFEKAAFAQGTQAVGNAVAAQTASGAVTVLGGGDTAAAARNLGFEKGVTHVSTGGGASLEFFEGRTLPGLEPLYEGSVTGGD